MASKREQKNKNNGSSFDITSCAFRALVPKTKEQKLFLEAFDSGKHIVLLGPPGTGKTYLAVVRSLLALQSGAYERLIIIRSVVPTRDIGFLPGSITQKIAVFEDPYKSIIEQFDKRELYTKLKSSKQLFFLSTSFLRGLTFDTSIVFLDEAQNCTLSEIHTVMTRIGHGSRVLIAGDMSQCDLQHEQSGLPRALAILQDMPNTAIITFSIETIVRSDFVREWSRGYNRVFRTNKTDATAVFATRLPAI